MRRPALYLLTTTVSLGCLSCGPRDQASTFAQGLSPEQVRFASFLGREALLDLRASDAEDGPGLTADAKRFRLEEGWRKAQPSGTLAAGSTSSLSVYLADPAGLNLFLEYRPVRAQSIQVAINGIDVGQVIPPPSSKPEVFNLDEGVLASPQRGQRTWTDHVLDLDAGVLQAGVNRIVLSYSPPPGDSRLAAEFRTIGFVPSGGDAGTGPSEPLEVTEATLGVRRPGTLLIPFRSNEPLTSLSFGVTTEARPWQSTSMSLRMHARGRDVVLAEESLDSFWGEASYSAELPLSGHSGPGCFVVDVDMDPTGPPLRVEALHPQAFPMAVTPPRQPPLEAPDIVLIVLDAARADHFGAYGYPKDTTPSLDRLAAESLVFKDAFATAAYTVSSMTTMLTGLSFAQHGVTTGEHKLAESFTTLAEHLKEAGYRTLCLTANPYNAIASGLAQGCDLSEEFWRNVPEERTIDPYRISDRAIQQLADDPEEPVFMMLHYIPPHEPYAPRPEFDIFGDEGYTGSVDGTRRTLRGINQGELQATRADINEIVSLYDGNLRMGDDAVERLLDALRRRDRWDRTVVLVTSDHGEAFGEHGRMGHNTTVYDEMLHVPFILRLPDRQGADDVDTEALVTLADVVPTLLGQVGMKSRSALIGRDVTTVRTTDGPRHVVSRTGGNGASLAYRTPGWKAIEGPDGIHELYDLGTDPAERENLHLEQFETFWCMTALLQWELAGGDTTSLPEERQELSEDELRTLRSLGYIR